MGRIRDIEQNKNKPLVIAVSERFRLGLLCMLYCWIEAVLTHCILDSELL